MLTSLAFLTGFLAVVCAPGLIAQTVSERRTKKMNEAA